MDNTFKKKYMYGLRKDAMRDQSLERTVEVDNT